MLLIRLPPLKSRPLGVLRAGVVSKLFLVAHPVGHGKSFGEWHLWVYGGAWRLEKGEHVVVASGDDQTKIEAEIQCIEGCILQSFEIMTPALDALLTFEHTIVLRIFNIYSEENEDRGMDNWMLYTPDAGNVITVHPGGKWSYGL